MKRAAWKRAQRAHTRLPVTDDPHDAIDLELLALWFGISRLREHLRGTGRRRPGSSGRVRRTNVTASAKLRRKAA
jgi:hypothetical protein